MLAVFAAVALLLAGIALVVAWRTAPATVAPVQAAPVSPQQPLLVDATWLHDRLSSDTPPVVVDLNDHDVYAREHIPGAIHAWWQDAMDPFAETYGSTLRIADNPFTLPTFAPDIGATTEETVVVYDDSASAHAAWFVWRLRAHGYTNAVVLDGGLAAWKGAGYPTSAEASAPKDVAMPVPSWDTAYWDDTANIDTGRVWLALRLAGYEHVRVYDPGWQGWTVDPARPIEPLP